MEQQTISIAKAGIVCQLRSRTAILAAANPIDSKYNIKKSVIENINMSPALLSRFDLIYIMLDIANEKMDGKIAGHILNIYNNKVQQTDNE
jgi:DNA replication licensing factor MCM4